MKECTKNLLQPDDFDNHQLFFRRHFQISLLVSLLFENSIPLSLWYICICQIPLLYLLSFSSRSSVHLWCNSLAAACYSPVQPPCLCPVLLTLPRSPLKISALYVCVWTYTKQSPALIALQCLFHLAKIPDPFTPVLHSSVTFLAFAISQNLSIQF